MTEQEDQKFIIDLMEYNSDDDSDDDECIVNDEIMADAQLVSQILNKKSPRILAPVSCNQSKECSVCLSDTTGCLSCPTTKCGHSICADCYKRLLNICFCDKIEGQIIYCCPLCRDVTKYTNQEMYKILNDIGTDTLYTVPHQVCKASLGCPNFVRKCVFKKCGCRIQSKDVVVKTLTNLTFEQIVADYFT